MDFEVLMLKVIDSPAFKRSCDSAPDHCRAGAEARRSVGLEYNHHNSRIWAI